MFRRHLFKTSWHDYNNNSVIIGKYIKFAIEDLHLIQDGKWMQQSEKQYRVKGEHLLPSGLRGSCWGRHAICWGRTVSDWRTANMWRVGKEPEDKDRQMIRMFSNSKLYQLGLNLKQLSYSRAQFSTSNGHTHTHLCILNNSQSWVGFWYLFPWMLFFIDNNWDKDTIYSVLLKSDDTGWVKVTIIFK